MYRWPMRMGPMTHPNLEFYFELWICGIRLRLKTVELVNLWISQSGQDNCTTLLPDLHWKSRRCICFLPKVCIFHKAFDSTLRLATNTLFNEGVCDDCYIIHYDTSVEREGYYSYVIIHMHILWPCSNPLLRVAKTRYSTKECVMIALLP